MNKIFKIIWSKTKNSYVVVSEIAKRNGKCSSSLNKKLIAAFLAAGTVLSMTGSAWAAEGTPADSLTEEEVTTIEQLLKYVVVNSNGTAASAAGTDAIAIGSGASAKNLGALAIGFGSSVTVDNGVAIGASSIASRAAGTTTSYKPYDPSGAGHTDDTSGKWISKAGAVSVGSSSTTRQITNVAAGSADTDAVNVAQLRAVKSGDVVDASVETWKMGGGGTGSHDEYYPNAHYVRIKVNGEDKAEYMGVHYFSVNDQGLLNEDTGERTLGYANLNARGKYSVAMGINAYTDADNSLAILDATVRNKATGSIAIGNAETYVYEKATNAYAIGNNARVFSPNGIAFGNSVQASENAIAMGNSAKGGTKNSIAIGTNANASYGDGIIAIGSDSSTQSHHTIAIGDSAKVNKTKQDGSIAIGYKATASRVNKGDGTGAIAIGAESTATGYKAIAIGSNVQVKSEFASNTVQSDKSIAIGSSLDVIGKDNIAIGTGRTVAKFDRYVADGMIVIGASGQEEGSLATNVDNSVVIGTGANVTLQEYESVALGSYSKADKLGGYAEPGENDVEIWKLKLNSQDFAGVGDEVAGTLSIGYVPESNQKASKPMTRTLTYVGAGEISKTSTDAINGSQLYAAIDAMQFDIVGGDNVEVIKNTDDNGHAVYTIHALNAIVEAKPDGNVTVDSEVGEGGASNGQTTDLTGGETGTTADPTASEKQPIAPEGTNNHTTTYTVDAADSKVTGVTVEAGESTTSGITTTTEYTVTVTSDEQKVVDGKIETEKVSKSGTFTVTDTNTTYTIKADPGEDGSNIVNTYTVTGSDGKDLDPIVDTDTQYELSGEKGETNDNQTTPYTISLKGTDGSENTFKLMDTRNTVEAGDDTIVVESTENEDGSFKYTITSKAKSVSNVEVKAGSDNVIVTSDGDEEKKVYTVDVKTDGEVASGNTGIVTGDTVYKETRVEKDGNYIKKDNTAAENITELDKRLGENTQNITNIYNDVNKLDNRMRKGLAGAAALAALHPMDFNPDDKLQFSAGVGNYRGETAAALGAFYRPDESVMFSIGGTFGNADNMVNAGITFGLDGTRNRITRSRTAMAHEIVELKDHIARQDEQIAKLTELVNKLVGPEQQIENTVMFPDVPENHWAYQYVEDLQKQGIIEGYPDGLFKGGRSMTRYEFAAMLDRALLNGAKLDAKISKEFAAELSRIYVERISGQDNDRKKVERVRVNNSDSKYPEGKTRDVYGSKIVTEVPKTAEAK